MLLRVTDSINGAEHLIPLRWVTKVVVYKGELKIIANDIHNESFELTFRDAPALVDFLKKYEDADKIALTAVIAAPPEEEVEVKDAGPVLDGLNPESEGPAL